MLEVKVVRMSEDSIRHSIYSFIVADAGGNWFRIDPWDPAQVTRFWVDGFDADRR